MKILPRKVESFPSLHNNPEPKLPDETFFFRPYLGDAQTLVILDLLERLNVKKVFEYGAGFSTIFFARMFPNCKWDAVEHHPYFSRKLSHLLPKNAVIHEEPIFGGYVEIAGHFEPPYDFIFVDGERREDCIAYAHKVMRPGAVLMRHDAGLTDEPIMVNGEDVRKYYKEHGIIEGMFWALR